MQGGKEVTDVTNETEISQIATLKSINSIKVESFHRNVASKVVHKTLIIVLA